ncbi:POK9 protein, partial [Corvus moneduloides]|nr:POK9 protein [Corvus moneduloides]
QLRGTVNESGLQSEPAKQMLNYVWGSGILCPEDIKTIVRMIQSAECLRPATRGSLGLDLATAIDVTLTDDRPQKVPTGIKGPLIINGQCHGALLLGRFSSSMKGLFILTGLIDKDYKGEICIMVQTHFPPVHILAHSKIAQLIPLPHLTAAIAEEAPERGTRHFGSTGSLTLLTLPLARWPVATAVFTHGSNSITLSALLDSGADLTIVANSCWPQHWPLQHAAGGVEGVGGTASVQRS